MTPTATSRVSLGAVLHAIWLAGIALLALRAGLSVLLLQRIVRRARVVEDVWILSRIDAARGALKLTRPVRLLMADTDSMPATWGIFTPTLILPASALRWREQHGSRLDAVLMHELSHVVRRDAVAQLVARAAVALFWCNPLVWFAARQARLERERACDDAVLASGTMASSYAEELMALLEALTPTATPALSMARESQIEQRIGAILDSRANRRSSSSASMVLVALLVALSGSVAAVRLEARRATNPVVHLTLMPALIPQPLVRAESYEPTLIVKPESARRGPALGATPAPATTLDSARAVQARQTVGPSMLAPADESWPQFRARSLEILTQIARLQLSDGMRLVEIGTLDVRDTNVYREALNEVLQAARTASPAAPSDFPAVRTRFDEAWLKLGGC